VNLEHAFRGDAVGGGHHRNRKYSGLPWGWEWEICYWYDGEEAYGGCAG